MAVDASGLKSPAGHRWALFTILLLGLALRVFYASYGARVGRFEDEQYSLLNIESILDQGTLAPASTFYPYPLFNLPPAALVGLSEALHESTGRASFRTRTGNGGFAAAGYLLCRWVQCLYGVVALWLLYRLGRELASSRVGLMAAATLAFIPWHVHASGYFKPDAQLTAMVLLSLLLSLRALRRGGSLPYVWAGLAIAGAMSSKLTGGLVALPLAFGVCLSAVRSWRQGRSEESVQTVRGLLVAAVTSCAAFIILNPYWRSYPEWLRRLTEDYAMRAGWTRMSRLDVPGRVVQFLLGDYALGAVLGWTAVIALVVLVLGAMRWLNVGFRDRIASAVFLIFPLLYTAAYALQTANFKANNFLPLIPLACLALAWALDTAWQLLAGGRLVGRFSPLSRAALAASLLLLWLVPVAVRGWLYAYREVTPTTMDRAKSYLGRQLAATAGRIVLSEVGVASSSRWFGQSRLGRGHSSLIEVEALPAIDPSRLARSDGEIFPRSKLHGADGKSYRQRLSRVGKDSSRQFAARLFRLRGPDLVAIAHPWPARGDAQRLELDSCAPGGSCRTVGLPEDSMPGELISFRFWLPLQRVEPTGEAWIDCGDQTLPLHLASRRAKGAEFVSERLEAEAIGCASTLHWSASKTRKGTVVLLVHRWQ